MKHPIPSEVRSEISSIRGNYTSLGEFKPGKQPTNQAANQRTNQPTKPNQLSPAQPAQPAQPSLLKPPTNLANCQPTHQPTRQTKEAIGGSVCADRSWRQAVGAGLPRDNAPRIPGASWSFGCEKKCNETSSCIFVICVFSSWVFQGI